MSTRLIDRIAFEVDPPAGGVGDAVLMIHGLGGTSNTWTPLLPAFSRFGVVRMDLPGAGRSERVEGMLSIERFVQAAWRVMSAAGIEKAHVAGHSMGTIVALAMAAIEPARVRSLALFGPLLAPAEGARAGLRARAQKARNEGTAGMQVIADDLVRAATSAETRAKRPVSIAFIRESLMRQSPVGYARCCEALAEASPADIAAIKCPCLLVTGDEDAVAPAQSVRMLAEQLAAAGSAVTVEVLRGCGHWTPVEKPDECIDLLRRFYGRRG